jgi:CubicO group peptidase (beta-lactamase class C family)
MRKVITRRLIRVFLAILLAFVLILIAWSAVAGPVTVYRVITRGDTTIYDYRRFPGRSLYASPVPFQFSAALLDNTLPESIQLENHEEMKLDVLLETSRTLAFLVIKDDIIIHERYLRGHGESDISQVFSTSKSILSLLIGTAIDDGLIKSVEDPVTAYVPELANAGFERVTIEDLLNMQSNMDYFENDNPFGEHVIFNFTDHLEDEILDLKLLQTPDEQFRYKSGDNALLGLVLDRALGGETITQYTQERIWNPLGMEDSGVWGVDRLDGLERTWCCLSVSARDLAKFGRLYLRNGNWDGTEIVSSDWVETSTTQGAYKANEWPDDLARIWNYKYQWWLISEEDGDYSTLGKDGQYLYVNPEKNLIIIRLGETTGDLPWFQIFREISAGIQ